MLKLKSFAIFEVEDRSRNLGVLRLHRVLCWSFCLPSFGRLDGLLDFFLLRHLKLAFFMERDSKTSLVLKPLDCL